MASVPPDPLIGLTIDGRFEIRSVLGRGGYGAVYCAHQASVGRDVAIKVLHAGLVTDEEIQKRFENEARIIGQLRHPGTLKLFDFGTMADGSRYIVTELLQGQPLDAALAHGAIDPLRTVVILRKICEVLVEAHARGVVHRDLKPANVFLEKVEGVEMVKVLDFGIARLGDAPSITGSGAIFGTPSYMSPEQARGDRVDATSDLYSLGIIGYECISGAPPFAGTAVTAILLNQVQDTPPPLVSGSAPPELLRLITQCLAKSPADRPASAEITRARLETIERSLMEGAHESTFVPGSIAPLKLEVIDHTSRRDPVVGPPPARSASWPKVLLAAPLLAAAVGLYGWSGRLPAVPEINVEVITAGPGADGWFARAAERLTVAALRKDRRLALVRPADANTDVRLSITTSAEGAIIDASARRRLFGRWVDIERAQAGSVQEALMAITPRITDLLGAGQPVRAPSEKELNTARRLGTDDVENVRRLDAVIECYYAIVVIEVDTCEALANDLVSRAPRFVYAHLALAAARGGRSPGAMDALKAGRLLCASPAPGCREIASFLGEATFDRNAAIEAVLSDPEASRAELFFAQGALTGGTVQLMTATNLTRRLAEVMPELQFHAELAARIDPADVDALLARWENLAPEAPQRLLTGAERAQYQGHIDEARALLGRAILLHGPRLGLLIASSDLEVEVGDLVAARARLAPIRVSSSAYARAIALQRLGVIAAYDGEYRKAEDLLRNALSEAVPYGDDAHPSMSAEPLRQLARALRDDNTAERADEALHAYSVVGQAYATQALIEYERASREEKCPSLSPFFAAAEPFFDRRATRRLLEQKAAAAGCLPCSQVVTEGFEPEMQFFDASLIELALCAEREGKLDLALRVLETPVAQGFGPSPHHKVLGKLMRGRILEKLNRPAEARAAYEESLRFWKNADHPAPEIALARAALERL